MRKLTDLKKKSIIPIFIFSFIFILSLGMVSALETANLTVNVPSASAVISGNSEYNVTMVSGYEAENYTAIFIWASSASLTANTTETLWYQGIANTTDVEFTNATGLDTLYVEDGTDYTLKFELRNGTDSVNVTRAVTIDNTIPQAPTLSPSSNNAGPQTSSTTQTFTGTVTDENTTACTYVISRGGGSSDGDSSSSSYSTTSCSFTKTFSDSSDNGDWEWYITASDGTNTTQSAVNTFSVQIPASNGGLPGGSSGDDGVNNLIWWIVGIIVLLIILYIIYVIIFMS